MFAHLAVLHGSVRSVLGGTAEGDVLLAEEADGSVAILRGPEGVYLAGNAVSPAAAAAARAQLNGWDYIIASPGLAGYLDAILPHAYMLQHQRVRLAISPAASSAPTLPDGYTYASSDEPLATEIVHQGEVVARCGPDLTIGSYTEIGIHTHPDHRRRGLALAATRATLQAAAAAGFSEVGWHCLASNRGSLAVARAAGLVETHRYDAYAEILPAENAGDLPPAVCRAHAERLLPGVGDHIWLGFHIAGAWAQCGEIDLALGAIERLVSSHWLGQAEWLEHHWSLAPLRTEPRFLAAVAAQRAQTTER